MQGKRFAYTLAVVLGLCACGGSPKPAPAPAPVAENTLFTRLGGKVAIEGIVDELLKNVGADNRINQRFAKVDLVDLRVKLVDLICESTKGPCKYQGSSL